MAERDRLYLLTAPFEDGPDGPWFCFDCAAVEGALLASPHWADRVEIHRLAWPRPRAEIVAILGEGAQDLPALVLADGAETAEAVLEANGMRFLTDPRAITRYLTDRHGGAAPHP
ncbi:DUF3088 family protein [Euryhalocaulis caribicus]|uniref:DUF3088 family protein n=1 Tax=Euryhalocaulis caribicus TaxID=1161401 RepID=UPI00039F5397|nr:DUF3088 family protein [Euryhalocaulis caribicus]